MLFGRGRLCYVTRLEYNKEDLVRRGTYQRTVEPTGDIAELIVESVTPKGCIGSTSCVAVVSLCNTRRIN